MEIETATRLSGLTRERIEALASVLGRRTQIPEGLTGADAMDFIQEAVRRVLSGARSLRAGVALEENLLGIAQSLVWNERKKAAVRREAAGEGARAGEDSLDVDALWNLHVALEKVRRRFGEGDARRADADARTFLDALVDRLDRRESIKPGVVSRDLGWTRDRAYAAWRRVKDVVRDAMEENHP